MKRTAVTVALAALAALAAAAPADAQLAFRRLGLPAGQEPGNPAFTDAYGVANDGTVVGSMYVPNVGFRGFRWTEAGGLQQINGVNPDSGLFARAVTPDGGTIVGENTGPGVAFRLVGAGPIQNLSFPQTGEYDQSFANDVSDDGQVVAGGLSRVKDGTFRAGRWTAAGWQDLGVLDPGGDYESSANAISADGSVVAGYSVGAEFKAFKWTAAGGMVALNSPFGATGSTAIAMSADAGVIGGSAFDADGVIRPVAWLANSTIVLNTPDERPVGQVFAVSGSGTLLAGTVGVDNGTSRAALWNLAGEFTDLQQLLAGAGIDLTGWSLTDVTEISANGLYLTGRGINPDGFLESFVVTIPAPGASAVALALVPVLIRRRRPAR